MIGGDGDRGQWLLEQEAEGVAFMEQGQRSSSGPSPEFLRHHRQVPRDRAEAAGHGRGVVADGGGLDQGADSGDKGGDF